jgi:hypothetical protein
LSEEQDDAVHAATDQNIISVIEVENCCPGQALRFTEGVPNSIVNTQAYVVRGSDVSSINSDAGQGLVCGGYTTDQLVAAEEEKSAGEAGGCAGCMAAPPNLTSWWPGDNNADDIKDHNPGVLKLGILNNTYFAAAFVNGMVGNTFSFDGVDDYVIVQPRNNLNPRSEITLSAWVRAESWRNGTVVQKEGQYGLFAHDKNLTINLPGVENGTVSIPVPSFREFHFIAATYNGSVLKLYVDGIVKNQSNASGLLAETDEPFYIGTSNFGAPDDEHFYGQIDELQLYNRSLAASEIKAEFTARHAGKCKPACSVAYSVKQLESRLIREVVSGSLSQLSPHLDVATTLGDYLTISMLNASDIPVKVTVAHPAEKLVVSNSEMRVVSAFSIAMENYLPPAKLELSVPVPANDSAAWLFVHFGDTWLRLNGERKNNKLVIVLSPEEINRYFLASGAQRAALFTVLSISDLFADRLEKVYDGGGKRAVLFVQGITVTQLSVKKFVYEYEAAQDDVKVYSFAYTPTRPLDEIAKSLAEQASSVLLEDGVNELYIVPYSFGGLVTQDALTYAKNNGLALATLSKKVIYVGTPFGGSPLLEIWNRFFSYILNTRVAAGIFSVPTMDKDIVEHLKAGKQELKPSVDADYGLVIGTLSYPWTEAFFNTTNDGVIADPAAHPQWFNESKSCDSNVLRVHVTHDQLPGTWSVRDFVYKLTNVERARANPSAPLLGYSQSVDVRLGSCQPGDRIVIVGDYVADKERPYPCSCGDGVCGVGENAKTCPEDCASAWQRFNFCLFMPWIINAILVVILAATSIYIYRKEKTHERGKGFGVLITLLVIIFAMVLAHYLECRFLLPLAVILILLMVIMIAAALFHFRKPKPLRSLDDALKRLHSMLKK